MKARFEDFDGALTREGFATIDAEIEDIADDLEALEWKFTWYERVYGSDHITNQERSDIARILESINAALEEYR